MALVPDESNQFKAKIGTRSSWDVLDTIKTGLRGRARKSFKRSCFGHFWKVPRIQFQAQLYLHLLFRQDRMRSMERVVFHINEQTTIFGPEELCLITGLGLGSLPPYPDTSNFHEKFFAGSSNIYVSDIKNLFETVCKEDSGVSDRCLKLALLYFLEGLLLARDRSKKKIELKHLHLLDDLQIFNSHPWARVVFDYLMWDIRRFDGRLEGYEKRKARKDKHNEERFDANGFSYALQVWAYEVMPAVAIKYGARVKEWQSVFPRILRYKAHETPGFDEIKHTFFPSMMLGDKLAAHIRVIPRLQPGPDETNESYYVSMVNWREDVEKIEIAKGHPKRKHDDMRDNKEDDSDESYREKKSKIRYDIGGPSNPQTDSTRIGLLEAKVDDMKRMFEDKIDEVKELLHDVLSELRKREEPNQMRDRRDHMRDQRDHDINPERDLHASHEAVAHFPVERDPVRVHGRDRRPAPSASDDRDFSSIDKTETEHNPSTDHLKDFSPVDNPGLNILLDTMLMSHASTVLSIQETYDASQQTQTPSGTENVGMVDLITPEKGKVQPPKNVFKRRKHESKYKKSPYTTLSLHKKQQQQMVVVSAEERGQLYNPMGDYDAEFVKAFEDWRTTNYSDETVTVESSVRCIGKVNAKWFDKLYPLPNKDGNWLSSDHIDGLLSLLVRKSLKWWSAFLLDWTCVDTMFWQALKAKWAAWKESKEKGEKWVWYSQSQFIMKYVTGSSPLEGARRWSAASRVFGVAHVFESHWVAYELHISSQEIVVYDSLSKSRRVPRMKKEFEHMAAMLSSICLEADVWAQKAVENPKEIWTVKPHKHPPNQVNGDDCGVLAVKFVECLATGYPIENIDPSRCVDMRKRYCAEMLSDAYITL